MALQEQGVAPSPLTRAMSRILCSISEGWSPTGTRVMPGRSTRVMVLRRKGARLAPVSASLGPAAYRLTIHSG